MAITDWPVEQRPREKLLLKGATTLSDAELLAIFLRTGVKGKSAVDLAHDLINEFSSLRSLFEADLPRFSQSHGLGEAKYVQLQAVLEMSRRYLNERLKRGNPLSDPESVRYFFSSRLRDYPHEVFACLYLDSKHRVIEFEELFRGSISSANVYPREVVKRALHFNAAAVIFAHNHPSGVAEPSQADESITQQLKQALALVDVRVLDHFIVGDEMTSMVERGLM